MTKLTLDTNMKEIVALSEELRKEIEPLLRLINETKDQITDKMEKFYAKLDDPKQIYYELDIIAPEINGKMFRFGEWDDEPYWVSSSELC